MKKLNPYARYQQQMILRGFGEQAQLKLKHARVFVAGAGGLGFVAMQYTTHGEMALDKLNEIQTALFEKYQMTGLNIFHSTGIVRAGEICFFVLAVSKHRAEAIAACSEAVERVKSELPVWGKLILENASAQWKENN